MLMQRQSHILSERQRTEQGPILKQHAKAPPHPPELAFRFPAAVRTITDIVCQYSAQTGEAVFLYELDGRGPLVRPELAFREREQILPPIKDMPLHGPRKPDDVPQQGRLAAS